VTVQEASKEEIQRAIKVIEGCFAELQLLRSYNFNGLYGRDLATPARSRLIDIGHRLAQSSTEIMRSAACLAD